MSYISEIEKTHPLSVVEDLCGHWKDESVFMYLSVASLWTDKESSNELIWLISVFLIRKGFYDDYH